MKQEPKQEEPKQEEHMDIPGLQIPEIDFGFGEDIDFSFEGIL